MNMNDAYQIAKKIHEDAFKIEVEVCDGGKLPSKAHRTDAGWDLYATDDITLYPGSVIKHPVNIRMKLPPGTWAEITTKSGLGSKGQLVKDVQTALGNLTVDGIYGQETVSRIRSFQESKGLLVDGVVGPETRSALGI